MNYFKHLIILLICLFVTSAYGLNDEDIEQMQIPKELEWKELKKRVFELEEAVWKSGYVKGFEDGLLRKPFNLEKSWEEMKQKTRSRMKEIR